MTSQSFFFPGEVVVDIRFGLSVSATHRVCGLMRTVTTYRVYIPSRRILKEGGYEGEGAMIYYDRPTRFAPAVEDMIIHTVHELLPETFRVDSL